MSETTVVEFADHPLPDWPADALVTGKGGAAKLWRARDQQRRAWFALVRDDYADQITACAWSRPRRRRANYSCAQCGSGHSRDHCRHIRAATVAATEWERRTT